MSNRDVPFALLLAALAASVTWSACGGDAAGPTCQPSAEACNGRDDDCDGQVDEGFDVGAACTAGVGACATAGQKVCAAGGAAALCNAVPGAPSTEVCNQVDDDCDGQTDDGLPACCQPDATRPCGADMGVCQAGTETCGATGAWGACLLAGQPVILPGTQVEACNGLDDDCDGQTDEPDATGCTTFYEDQDADGYGTGAGACLCAASAPFTAIAAGDCDDLDTSAYPGAVEVCNGKDDDCDGQTDQGDPGGGVPCDGPDSDLCNEGTRSCVGGVLVCSDATGGTVDLCNGLDDDCDAASADGSEDPLAGTACDGPDSDLCAEGTRSCVGGALVCSDNTASSLDVCNGLDDDCDAASADGSEDPLTGTACDGPDSDLCAEGTRSCVGGALVCSDNTGGTLDLCNGVDDDCDPASADGSEDPLAGAACDGSDTDLCLEGTLDCASGILICSDSTSSTAEICNGLDDNCNGSTDEGGVCCGGTCYYYTGSCSPSYIGACDGCDMGCAVHDPDCDGSACMDACPCLAGYSHWFCDGFNDCVDPACECAGE